MDDGADGEVEARGTERLIVKGPIARKFAAAMERPGGVYDILSGTFLRFATRDVLWNKPIVD